VTSSHSDAIIYSKENEMRIYLASMRNLYENAVLQNGEIYDLAFELTYGFSRISPEAVVADSRIIRILRYMVAPSISQMKFGQMFGLSSIERMERDKIVNGKALSDLKVLAPGIAEFMNQHFDRTRCVWIGTAIDDATRKLAEDYAKNWTCSLIADQNAQTEYRNWRKAQQESAIERTLIDMGYIRSGYVGDVKQQSDINIGDHSKERKVKGATLQKADLIVRRKRDGKLILLEAKAVGVQVDAFKRVKECCDKARDWQSNPRLGKPEVVVVIGGFFAEQNLSALSQANVHIVWEHNLDGLREFLNRV
jgi:hypothetical protein